MASQGPPPPPREGLDLATLFISAIASAAAAYVTSKIWAPGTLFSAALSPVIVALVKEGLRKPTEVITNVVPQVVPTPSKWTRASPDDAGLVAEVEQRPVPGTKPPPDAPPPVIVPTGQTSPVRVYSTRGRRLRWRLAVVTGLLGFGIAVLAFTVPELIAGQSLGGSHKTTIFGGHHRHRSSTTKTTTSTTSTSTQRTTTTATTPTQTTTVTRTATVTTPTTPAQTTTTPSTAAPSSTAPQSAAPQGAAPTPPG
jgi:hypothetical protein